MASDSDRVQAAKLVRFTRPESAAGDPDARGYWVSKCGRFEISPNYWGRVNAVDYSVIDRSKLDTSIGPERSPGCKYTNDRVGACKEWAVERVARELAEAREAEESNDSKGAETMAQTRRNSNSNFQRGMGVFNCGVCGKRTRGATGVLGPMLCQRCYDEAGLENEHSDYGHSEFDADCPTCRSEREADEAWEREQDERASKAAEAVEQIAKQAVADAKREAGAGWDLLGEQLQRALVSRQLVSVVLAQQGGSVDVLQAVCRKALQLV